MKNSMSMFLNKADFDEANRSEELRACHERIEELKASLAEMVGIYWGEGDGIHPAPQCIKRAWAALGEEVR